MLDALLGIKTNLNFDKRMLQRFYCYFKNDRWINKKQICDNGITKD